MPFSRRSFRPRLRCCGEVWMESDNLGFISVFFLAGRPWTSRCFELDLSFVKWG